jgi:copper(I)-binding protein
MLFRSAFATLGLMMLVACSAPSAPNIKIEFLSVRQGHAADVGYFSIRNLGETDDKLLAVESSGYQRIEMHATNMQDGIMQMRQIDSFEVAAGTEYRFAPKGYHLMLFGRYETVANPSFTFRFELSPPLTLTAKPYQSETEHHNGSMH